MSSNRICRNEIGAKKSLTRRPRGLDSSIPSYCRFHSSMPLVLSIVMLLHRPSYCRLHSSVLSYVDTAANGDAFSPLRLRPYRARGARGNLFRAASVQHFWRGFDYQTTKFSGSCHSGFHLSKLPAKIPFLSILLMQAPCNRRFN